MLEERVIRKALLPAILLAFLLLTFAILMWEIEKAKFPKIPATIYFPPAASKEPPYQLPLLDDLKTRILISGSDFIELNLEEMTTFLYRNGKTGETIPILAKGNPKNWGGSPAGLYEVMNKHRIAFSNSSRVYMPFSIQYYGKFFLHGVPYYPGGARVFSTFSGGCIRYTDANAEKIFDFAKEGMPVLVIDKPREDFSYPEIKTSPFPNLSSENFLIADIESGTVLAERNPDQKAPIASITKLMTAVVVAENIGLNRPIYINEDMMSAYEYTPKIEEGKRFQLIELLYPLLTRSSNQAAEALAGYLDRETTIEMMNEKAKKIMMEKTSFSDPSGFDHENTSTAKDLFYLGRYIYNNLYQLLPITKGERVSHIQYLRFDLEELGNKNIFIYDPSFIGGKTGFTNASKQTAIFFFSFPFQDEEREVIMIFLKSQSVKRDAQMTYKWLLDNYFN